MTGENTVRLSCEQTCDVLVVGSGIAGISAALRAAETGCRVILVSSAPIFSGSSFYPGTWGLGLVGPEDKADQRDLQETILRVGCGMAIPEMVETFVGHIPQVIADWKEMGVPLRTAAQRDQKEFIPCFDHKRRDWNGIEFSGARPVLSRHMEQRGVVTMPGCEVLRLVQSGGRVCGAVLSQGGRLHYWGCRALVLATGGCGRLFRYHLCTEDVAGAGQALALNAGCTLTNLEFFQIMPGYLSPAAKTIFNEKAFRFSLMRGKNGPLLPKTCETMQLLEQRSTHGPFTSRLPSKAVDIALYRFFRDNPCGVEVRYTQAMQEDPPEFIRTYFDWLEKEKHLTMADPIQIGVFAHAQNGGVRIRPDASTGVPGLFACGEVTGGMHGADRIGGLSTANGLVFGTIAGQSAAACRGGESPETVSLSLKTRQNIPAAERALQDKMFREAMILRTERGLSAALETVLEQKAVPHMPTENVPEAVAAFRLEAQLTTAECLLKAALLRRESRGSHYRADYPAENPAEARRIEITAGDGCPQAHYVSKE